MTINCVSIIIPIRNEAAYIGRCLDAISSQDYPGEMEIFVVDGLSTDQTREIVAAHPLSARIRILDNTGKIVPTGMNIALRQARGDVIIRVDGHCIIAPDYVRCCVEHLQRDEADGVGGPMASIGETDMARAIALGMSSPFGVGNSAFRTISGKNMLADTVPFPAYTREIIQRAGLYDEELVRNQDDEYNYRIRELGGKILLVADVQSTYFSRTSLTGLWHQYYQYGYWKVRVLQKHPLQMSLRQFIPPLFVLGLIISIFIFCFSFILHSLVFVSVIIPVIYIIANLFASSLTMFRGKDASIFYMPLIYAILHLSYGAGFLAGLLAFRQRWGDRHGKVPSWDGFHA